MDRVVPQMDVTRRRLDIAVAERLADHRQGFPKGQRTGREGVREATHQGSTGVMCVPMLSPTREPDVFTDSLARWA